MFDRISNGISLARSSWSVLMKDKHLLVFPMVSGLMFLIVVASFAVPLAALVDWSEVERHMQHNRNRPPVWVYPVTFAFYFCCYFVMIFCNSAMLSCAFLRLNGRDSTLGDGFRAASARLPQIAAWAFVSATVGLILKAIENANEKIGSLVASLLGAAWSIMTFFVVPVLVVEKVDPFTAIGRSASLLRKTWGEAAVGNLGLGLFLFLLTIPVFLVFGLGLFLMATGSVLVGLILLAAGVIGLLMQSAVSSALHTILLAALYQYAANGRVSDEFERETFSRAFTRTAA